MHKGSLAAELRKREPWMTRQNARDMVNHFFGPDGIIPRELARGAAVEITSFGRFDTIDVSAREVSAIPGVKHGGERYKVAAHRRVTFRAGRSLRALVKAIPDAPVF